MKIIYIILLIFQGSLRPGAVPRIISTTSTREKTWDHLKNSTITDARYKTMLQSFRKRKMIEPVRQLLKWFVRTFDNCSVLGSS